MKLKTKSEELECVIFILPFNLRHHSFYTRYTTICEDFYPLNGRRRTLPYPTRTPYICFVGPTVHDSLWYNIEPSHDKTWLRCVRRITTQISLRICTVYSNKRFFVSCFDSSACNNGSYVKKLRYVSSSCVQMQFTAAWRGPFLRPWTHYRTDWSGVDQ